MSNNAIFENERAINYDNFVNTWIPQYDFFMDMVTGMLTNIEMSPILIAGCGTGNEILSLLQSGIHGPITGVDPSPDMIAIARNKLKTYPQVNLVDGEVQVLPEGKVYSAATLILVLHFIKEDDAKLSLLKEIAERMRPGAPFIIMNIFGDTTEIRENLNVLKTLLPDTVEDNDITTRFTRIESEFDHLPENKLIDLLKSAGFIQPIRFYQTAIYGGWLARKA